MQQAHQAAPRIVAQRLHARVVGPLCQALAHRATEVHQHRVQFGMLACGFAVLAVANFAFAVAAEQDVELLGHHFAVRVQLTQESTGRGMAQGLGDPGQVVVTRGQHMGLLVIEVLDAVLHLAQKHIGGAQGISRGLRGCRG